MDTQQCNKKEFEYILKDTVNILNKNRTFKKNKLFCYGTQFYDPVLNIIFEKDKKYLKPAKSTGNWESSISAKEGVDLVSMHFRREDEVFGFKIQYSVQIFQKLLKKGENRSNILDNYFFYLDDRFWDREFPRKLKDKAKLAYTIDKLPDNLAASLSKFCDFLLNYKNKTLLFDDEMDLYESTNFGNPWALEHKYRVHSFDDDY